MFSPRLDQRFGDRPDAGTATVRSKPDGLPNAGTTPLASPPSCGAVSLPAGRKIAGQVVAFYFPEREALCGADPADLDPDRDWQVFGTGVYVWILQTFLRLRAYGAPVQLVEAPPSEGIVVVHARQFERLLAEARRPAALTIVCARSDKGREPLADVEIVQNASAAEEPYQFFIPSWLQPGLVARAPSRGTRVEQVSYFGSSRELHEDLVDERWGDLLGQRGLRWDSRTIRYSGGDTRYDGLTWNDYSTTDIVVALRSPAAWNRPDRPKPAAKLQNAWAAGVPAILSPEVAYQELRRSSLDYIEARTAEDVLSSIENLRADHGLYAAMVRNGLERAKDFQSDRLAARWADVLWNEAASRAHSYPHRLFTRARSLRALGRRARHGVRIGSRNPWAAV